MPRIYTPTITPTDKVGVVLHYANFKNYPTLPSQFKLISPLNDWKQVLDEIASCRAIISSSLHGLICADAYGIPNVWLEEYPILSDNIKFHDYFLSQGRPLVKLTMLSKYSPDILYKGGNTINLDILESAFPFKARAKQTPNTATSS